MKCKVCKSTIRDGVKFCPLCGSKVDEVSSSSKRERKALIPTIIVCMAIAVSGILGVILGRIIVANMTGKTNIKSTVDDYIADNGKTESSVEDGNQTLDNEFFGNLDLRVGEVITLGRYEQDDDLDNGKEPMEWEVIAVEEGRALLKNCYVIEQKKYNDTNEPVTWATCSLRSWLNNEFYNESFSPSEQSQIITSQLANSGNPVTETEGGNETYDNIFVLSIEEIIKYYPSYHAWDDDYEGGNSVDLMTPPTAYVENRIHTGELTIDDLRRLSDIGYTEKDVEITCADWWTRTPGYGNDYGCPVLYAGFIGYVDFDYSVADDTIGVCPSLWIATTDGSESKESGQLDFSNTSVGDYLVLGSYEQDSELDNGKEPIEWEVLAIENERALLISRYVLEEKKYHKKASYAVTWETCSLRTWLNEDFYNEAFSPDEKKYIQETYIVNDDNPIYGTDGGNDTLDRVFCLSISEMRNYYDFNTWVEEAGHGFCQAAVASPTLYAEPKLETFEFKTIYADTGYTEDIIGVIGACWWLRTPGFMNEMVYCVDANGFVGTQWKYITERDAAENYIGVRPAIWVGIK